ncbi:transmembrane protein 223 [Aricia agestis]|uniref:transmembrane protein 223 n=1 Tax=Aricia agestis TaxID=91739 RepID=UPI001C20507E|nr:transmembrane protein 223 [Aricia agestis]XP_041987012.1 transmembrane protein 223 [Aricia agestis]
MNALVFAGTILRRQSLCSFINTKRCFTANTAIKFNSVATKTVHDVNTNVAKDVILFKYENPKFYKYMNIFAVIQYVFWTYLGFFAFKSLKDAPVDRSAIDENTPWFKKINLGENKYKNTLSTIAIVIGTGSLAMIWMYTLKSVRYLILNKGGRHVTFVTYSPFGQNRIMKVPVENICCKEHRRTARVQLPLKVKNTFMHYMLDMRGEFKNVLLFDSTAGLKRVW